MPQAPNILLIMTDQQRCDSLGCYGGRIARTPVLDRLAAEGALFENACVNATICTPSRASLMTGKPLPGHGVYKLHDNLPEDQVLFPKLLQRKGYRTALFGKLHVSGRVTEANQRHPHDGFNVYELCNDPTLHLDSELNAYAAWIREHHPDFWARLQEENRNLKHFPIDAHHTYWAADRTIDFLERQTDEQPFFCMMSLFDPHDPYDDYPLEALDTIDGSRIGAGGPATDRLTDVPDGVHREKRKYVGRYADKEISDDLCRGYHASVGFLDQQIGRVLRKLEECGFDDRTLVIFVSDHGEMLGDKQLYTKGAYFYDACVKVPFLLKMPGTIPPGVRRQQLVQLHDIAASVVAAAGFGPDELDQLMPDAINVLPLAADNKPGRDYAVTQYRNSGYSDQGSYWTPSLNCTMFRDNRYKLHLYHDVPEGEQRQEGELFDTAADPGEEINLWYDPAYADVKLRLLLRFTDWTVQQENRYVSGRGGEAVTW
ncbi:sulfatase family protein [Paenibacillus oceani]|uniref:Sulfatase-like hydrolase/transferase n=1 Tax=Paenibacillus oceani TaxID=2772510 RepID=A0A927CA80_9BACL|nr:sulfatase-like hydrolase/transferase [Paenibacillus oceani]MBD2862316.1 sulfatase-like hydrolase/transferase [Paenibacillus oceani]